MYFFTRSFSGQQPLEELLGVDATKGHVAPAGVIGLLIAGQPAAPFP